MDNNGLKPCPFCGAVETENTSGVYVRGVGNCFEVKCGNCRAASEYQVTPGRAVDAWNRRPTESRLYAALERIVETLVDDDDEGLITYSEQMIEARAALAQARGEAQ
jgi:Lar family restriction alleviation protein